MRIAPKILAYGEQFGGAERQIVSLCEELCRRGIPVSCFLQFERELAKQLRLRNIAVQPTQSKMLLPDLARSGPNGERPILHAHNTRSSIIASCASIRFGMPVVKTEHGAGPSARFADVVTKKDSASRLIETTALRLCNASIVFVSRDLADRNEPWAQKLEKRVIPNGVAASTSIAQRPPELPIDRFNILFAGRLDPVKAPTGALRAMALLPVNSRVHLTIIGDGPLAGKVAELASAPQLKNRVQILGFRGNAVDFVQHVDAVILPSLHEGLPYVALEALSAGTPLIATEVGGLREHFHHLRTVYFVEPGNDQALADAILELERNGQLRNDLRAAGPLLIADKLSVSQMADQYLEVYRSAVCNH